MAGRRVLEDHAGLQAVEVQAPCAFGAEGRGVRQGQGCFLRGYWLLVTGVFDFGLCGFAVWVGLLWSLGMGRDRVSRG